MTSDKMMTLPSSPELILTILCGGSGSRLWPLSREQHPKPLIRLDGKQSLLQQAFLRGTMLPNVNNVITVTNEELFFRVEEEYQEVTDFAANNINNHFILEPFGRDTGPAIAAACLQALENHGEDTIMLILAADHLILDLDAFSNAVNNAVELAQLNKIVTFGIQPTIPETGYGYIETSGMEVIQFVEKPAMAKAQEYVASGRYLWNSGMFCFQTSTMLKEMAKHSEEMLQTTKDCLKYSSTEIKSKNLAVTLLSPEKFQRIRSDSIDYAVMEKTDNAAVIPCDMGWSDIGCWRVLSDQTESDANYNRIQGDAVPVDSYNCSVNTNGQRKIVGLVGVENLLIADTHDALLIADKKKSQDVKKVYTQLKQQDHNAYKHHRTVYRPWGTHTILEEGVNFKIKRIEIKPEGRLSLQMHNYRNRHWIVISGTAKVVNGDKDLILNINESTFIPITNKYGLENIGKENMVFIEVQTGTSQDEDDIVRFDDIYGRTAC